MGFGARGGAAGPGSCRSILGIKQISLVIRRRRRQQQQLAWQRPPPWHGGTNPCSPRRLPAAAWAFGLGRQGPAIGADIFTPWNDAIVQVPVNPALWAASDKHYYPGEGVWGTYACCGWPLTSTARWGEELCVSERGGRGVQVGAVADEGRPRHLKPPVSPPPTHPTHTLQACTSCPPA